MLFLVLIFSSYSSWLFLFDNMPDTPTTTVADLDSRENVLFFVLTEKIYLNFGARLDIKAASFLQYFSRCIL